MSSLAEDIREKMMFLLREEEDKTDLEDLAVLSRVGMKVSSSKSFDLDADATSASSTALIDLGLRLSDATHHGGLKEIILHNSEGYSILMAINDEYIVFGGLRAIYRVGYYLGYLRNMATKLNQMISGDEATEMAISLQESQEALDEAEQETKQETPIKPSVEQDKEALDGLLGFLDDWEKEGADFEDLEAGNEGNIVSIPGTTKATPGGAVGLPESSETPSSTVEESFKIYEDEVPPIPLQDYTPMEMDDEPQVEEITTTTQQPAEDLPPLDELPSFDELNPPNFESNVASEYDTAFILEEESEDLDSVLKELGWDEEE